LVFGHANSDSDETDNSVDSEDANKEIKVGSMAHGNESDNKIAEEIKIILRFFTNLGDILWYHNNPSLSQIVMIRPMDLVRSLRFVVNHDVEKRFKSLVKFTETKKNLLQKGIISFSDFQSIYNGQAFTAEQTWEILCQLGLACLLIKDHEHFIHVPCLISQKNEVKVKEKEYELQNNQEALHVQYFCDHSSIGLYNEMLKVMTENLLWGVKGGDIELAYSQKVEGRKLGNVGGVQGTMLWPPPGSGRKSDVFQFLLAEYETEDPDEEDQIKKCFAVHRSIHLYIKPEKGCLSRSSMEILQNLDAKFSPALGTLPVHRRLTCTECQAQGRQGYLLLEQGMLLQPYAKCSEMKHTPDERLLCEEYEDCLATGPNKASEATVINNQSP
jgi:hypothetical protein